MPHAAEIFAGRCGCDLAADAGLLVEALGI
jgi:hypothetical protein